MSISLYTATVPGFIRQLEALRAIIEKAQAHCAETGTDPETLLSARFAPDMQDFCYQVSCASGHSAEAIEKVGKGLFTPPIFDGFARDFDGMKDAIDNSLNALNAMTEDDLAALAGKTVTFRIGDHHIGDFTGQDFLLSFNLPNFYFHITTAYDLLRQQGLAIGKRDFLGDFRKNAL